MRMERQVHVGVVELCVVGIGMRPEGRCNGSTRDIRSGSKRAGWMIQGKEHNFGGAGREELTGMRCSRGESEEHYERQTSSIGHWMSITTPEYFAQAPPWRVLQRNINLCSGVTRQFLFCMRLFLHEAIGVALKIIQVVAAPSWKRFE